MVRYGMQQRRLSTGQAGHRDGESAVSVYARWWWWCLWSSLRNFPANLGPEGSRHPMWYCNLPAGPRAVVWALHLLPRTKPGTDPYGGPGQGCLSDETSCYAPGVPGHWCSPACSGGGSCPQDKPVGVTANPQYADEGCALVCAASLPIIDQKAADSQCGAATCHPYPGQSFGICTYAYAD